MGTQPAGARRRVSTSLPTMMRCHTLMRHVWQQDRSTSSTRHPFMLAAIRRFFDEQLASVSQGPAGDRHQLAMAVCAMLAEAMRIDTEALAVERSVIVAAMERQFALPAAQVHEILALAEQEAAQATDYFQFTSLINRHFDYPRKLDLLEAMWQVALADARISAHERHLMRKVATLLHITEPDQQEIRLRAMQEAAQRPASG